MSYQIPWSLMSLQICGKMMIEAAKFGPRYRPFLQYSFSGRKIFRIRHLKSDVRWKSWILLLMLCRPQFWSSRAVLHTLSFYLVLSCDFYFNGEKDHKKLLLDL